PLCEYRVHGGQSHRRVQLVYATRLRILERFFARPGLPPGVGALRAEAFHEAHLVGAGELFAAGQPAEAQAAFLAAVRARPESLRDARTMRRFVRLLQPTGWQHQVVATGGWREVMRTLWGAVEATLATPGLEAEIAGQRWAARRAVLRTGARLLRKRLGRVGPIAAPVAPRQGDR